MDHAGMGHKYMQPLINEILFSLLFWNKLHELMPHSFTALTHHPQQQIITGWKAQKTTFKRTERHANTDCDQLAQWHQRRKQIRQVSDTVPSLLAAAPWRSVRLQWRWQPPSTDSDLLAAPLTDFHALTATRYKVWSDQEKHRRQS